MNELPCIGFAITVVDPGPSSDEVWRKTTGGRPATPRKRKRPSRADITWRERPPRLFKAFVTLAGVPPDVRDGLGAQIQWKCGIRYGTVFSVNEGSTWVRGHGPQARAALLAQRALEQQR